jgi:hypothetical protein
MYLRVRSLGFPKDLYQLLCHNCNQAKAWYGACPHQLKREEENNLLEEK